MSKLNIDQIKSIDEIIGSMASLFQEYTDGSLKKVQDLGLEHDIYRLIFMVVGSVDYFNTILLTSQYAGVRHPYSLQAIEDPISIGFIETEVDSLSSSDDTISARITRYNQDISNHIWWKIDNPPPIPFWHYGNSSSPTKPTYAATSDVIQYPGWNGYPSYDPNSILNGYPVNYSNERIPAYFCGQYFTLTNNDTISIQYSDTISISAPDIIRFSFWKNDYQDIRVFRVKSYIDGMPALSSPIEDTYIEVPTTISGDEIIFQCGAYDETDFIIFPDETQIYILYWGSPDIEVFTKPDFTAISPCPVRYTLSLGKYFNYFYTTRNDLVQFRNSRRILKSKSMTNYETTEQDPYLYIPPDPVFYPVSSLAYDFDHYTYGIDEISPSYTGALSTSLRMEDGSFPSVDSIYGIIISIKPECQITENVVTSTLLDYQIGPIVYPDMFPSDWKDFEYYPSPPKDYIPFVKLIVEQKKIINKSFETPSTRIVYLEYTYPYASRGMNNVMMATLLVDQIILLFTTYNNNIADLCVSNNLFSTYFAFLCLQVDTIERSNSFFEIINSHTKYGSGGHIGSEDTVRQSIAAKDTAISFDQNSTLETSTNTYGLEPWFENILYWRYPYDFSIQPFQFQDGSNWIPSIARGFDTSKILLNYAPGDDNYNPNSEQKQARDDGNQTGLKLTGKQYINSSELEIYFPVPLTTTRDNIIFKGDDDVRDVLNQDYTLSLVLRDKNNNRLSKDLMLSNANYFISDLEYQTMQKKYISTDGYLCPSTVSLLPAYKEYGDAALIPDCANGKSYNIYTKVFEANTTGNYTYEQYVQMLKIQYNIDHLTGKDLEIAIENMNEDILNYRERVGFATEDLRTNSSKFIAVDSAALAVTKYVYGSDPIWQNVYEYSSDYMEPSEGEMIFKTRYGYKVNNIWESQSFTQEDIITERTNYISSHITEDQITKREENIDNYNDSFSLNGTNSKLAQTFTADFVSSASLAFKIQLWLQRVGNAPDVSLRASIYSLEDNKPSNPIATSGLISFNDVLADGGWVSFVFSPYINFGPNAIRFAIVLDTYENSVNLLSSSNKIYWYYSSTSGSENREYQYYSDSSGLVLSSWELPSDTDLSASFRIYSKADDISPVMIVPFPQWSGSDITITGQQFVDSFYITTSSTNYVYSGTSEYISSYSPNNYPPTSEQVLAGFNVSSVKGFPPRNDTRMTNKNKVNGYWSWGTTELSVSNTIQVMPQANIYSDYTAYLPLYTNTFLTIGLRRADTSRKVIQKLLFGYNKDFGQISSATSGTITLDSDILNSQDSHYIGQWTELSERQFVFDEIVILDGSAENQTGILIISSNDPNPGDNQYEVSLLTALTELPNAGDHYIIRYSKYSAIDGGNLTSDPDYDVINNTTTITDNSKAWAVDFTGKTVWIQEINQTAQILSNTSDTITFANLVVSASMGNTYIIINTNASPLGFYGTNEPIVLDSEEYVAVDHMFISADGFPTDYWDGMGYTDSFMIRGQLNVTE